MDTLDYALWWQIYPLGACGTDMFSPQSDEYSGGETPDAEPSDGSTPDGAPTSERNVDKSGKLQRLEAWLDYAIELGCSGILLGPIFESTAHGYDTTNHLRRRLENGPEQNPRTTQLNRIIQPGFESP